MKKQKFIVIFYILLTILWLITTVLQIMSDDAELWIIIVDAIILVLTLITAIMNYRTYKKNK